jgi:hypothetical protein
LLNFVIGLMIHRSFVTCKNKVNPFVQVKKFITAILAFLYICTSTGATLQMHYCMGKLADWSIGHRDTSTCEKCGMKKGDKGCCKDEHKFFKDNTDQQPVKAGLQMLQSLATALPPLPVAFQPNYFPPALVENSMSHAPPPGVAVAVYIRNCVFLI